MRFYRLVSGDLMDRTALSCHRTFYYDGQNLSSDVPCLRTCSTDPSGLLQACPLSGYGTGDHLQLWDFFRGIFKRIFFSEASHLSLGLFSCSTSVQRSDPTGLCSSVVFYRSLFRMASSTKSSESLLKISQLYYMITGRNLISSK